MGSASPECYLVRGHRGPNSSRHRPQNSSAKLFGKAAAGFEGGQETVDFRIGGEAVELCGNIIAEKLNFGRGRGFRMLNAFPETIEGSAFRIVAEGHLGLGGFVESDAAAMARDQNFALGFSFVEFLFQLEESVLQGVHLRFLVINLLLETLREALAGLEAVEGRSGEIVLGFIDGDFG